MRRQMPVKSARNMFSRNQYFVPLFGVITLSLHLFFGAVEAYPAETEGAGNPSSVAADGPPRSYRLADVVISLERTQCLGRCPVYKVEIFGDGRVLYEGLDHVKEEGTRESVVSRQDIVKLLEQIYAVRFFEMKDRYANRPVIAESDGMIIEGVQVVTDQPAQVVSVRIGDYEKRVVHYYSGPQDLVELINRIDEIAGSDKWVG